MVAVGTFSFFMNSLVRYFIPSLLPVIEELDGISIVKASLLVTAYWSTYTAMQIPSGFISDRFGQATVNKASFLAMTALFSCFLALHSFAGLLAIQLLLGASSSLVYISDVSLIQRVSEPSRRAHAVGIYQTAFFVGASVAEILSVRLLGISFRASVLAFMPLMLAACMLNFALLSNPERKGRSRGTVRRELAYVAAIRFASGFTYLGFSSLFAAFIVFRGITSADSTYRFAWVPIFLGIAGSPLGGVVSRGITRYKFTVAVAASMALALSVVATGLLPGAWALLTASLSGFFYGLYSGPSMGLATEVSAGEDALGSASGFVNFSSQLGGSVSPFLIGAMVASTHSFSIPFLTVGTVSLALLIAVYIAGISGSLGKTGTRGVT
ncbi:MFS transporter [Thermogymnomonas acidicola]|uniref:MFS transporter n=1 Tax=Thermogymnomonas acidicola TaxID=399579 RepID=A0AA37BQK3_9ARCH|nr:MFS transporter [Thermogymnomonas acidicola]GGM68140.1 MFS transporter [Thermogymnomonas acidicola]